MQASRRSLASSVIGFSVVVFAATAPGAQAPATPSQQPVDFAAEIRPVLIEKCLGCHGEKLKLSKLDLRSRASALEGGAHGPALVPGNAEQSRMFRHVAGLEAPAMPMRGVPLTPAQTAALRRWIDQGAPWDAPITTTATTAAAPIAAFEDLPITAQERSYWAFQLPAQVPLPAVSHPRFNNPIDRFLESERAQRGLTPAPRADRFTLVRRAYLDLLGLPPSPEEVARFVADARPDAWERLIDSLLASPHYGERYGRHWLDVARYADSAGFEYDVHRPNAWRYRDYVIRSFNADKPFNVFLTEQIAGDEMDGRSDDTLIATGFLRAGPRVLFREKDNPERRFDYLDDVIGVIGKGTLGLTIGCARCHDHKFDPIRQKDYYALQAAIFGYVETEVPLAPKAEADAYLAKNEALNAERDELRKRIAAIEKPHRDRLELAMIKSRFSEAIYQAAAKPEQERTPGERLLAIQVFEAVTAPAAEIDKALAPAQLAEKQQLAARLSAIDKERPARLPMAEIVTDGDHRFSPLGEGDEVVSCPKCRIPPPFPGSYLHRGPAPYEVPPSYFLIRGDVESRGPQMQPGFVQVATYGNPPTTIPRPDGHTSGRRLALAQWIGSPQNPLTARVIVNRLWQKHFGRGLVSTLENFGKMGESPTHPELLDWMAVEFMNRGWSIKQINRLMMTSEAYQMASAFDHAANTAADPENRLLWRFRPQRLDAEIVRDSMLRAGGNINLQIGGEPIFPFMSKEILTGQFRGKWENTPEGPAAWRRGVYVYRRRSLPYPMFDTFDHPDMNVVAGARNVSTVPTQALTLLNNPFVLAQADRLAARVASAASGAEAQVTLAYRIALGRAPSRPELAIALEVVAKRSLASLTHVLLNLDEFVYMR
ncbi:MAG: DUF1553 domain-containing protein [Acidimicrobiia bacterium]|nr:DUF1553 domain-containing protein [Acidimicrobiia bacterium]